VRNTRIYTYSLSVVYTHMCVYICVYIYIYIHTFMQITRFNMCIYMYIYIPYSASHLYHTHPCVIVPHSSVYECMHAYISVRVCIEVCTFVCIFVCMYVCTYESMCVATHATQRRTYLGLKNTKELFQGHRQVRPKVDAVHVKYLCMCTTHHVKYLCM